MKSLDTFTKRILVLAAAISMVLLSLSAFIYTTQQVTALSSVTSNQDIVGLGVDSEYVYFAHKAKENGKGYTYYFLIKAPKKDALDKYKDMPKAALINTND